MERALTAHEELNYLDDSELITRAQNGDTEAFNPIVRRYRKKIYDLIYGRVHHHETAEDLCQEVFLKAWQALPNFKRKSVFYSWLYQIAINCSIDFFRRQKREIVFACEELPHDADSILQMTQTQSSPAEILEKEEFKRILHDGIRRLPSRQRHTFRLHYLDELPIKEIASRLDKSENTVKTHLYHARQKLQHLLRPYLKDGSAEGYKAV